jgi:hypothetical protein
LEEASGVVKGLLFQSGSLLGIGETGEVFAVEDPLLYLVEVDEVLSKMLLGVVDALQESILLLEAEIEIGTVIGSSGYLLLDSGLHGT